MDRLAHETGLGQRALIPALLSFSAQLAPTTYSVATASGVQCREQRQPNEGSGI